MKKSTLLFFFLVLFTFLRFSSLKAQIFSEAPVTVSEDGKRLSTMIYVKFKPKDLVLIADGEKNVDGNSITSKFSGIRKTISDFCKSWQLDLSDLRISKAIPNAKDEDTLFADIKTGEVRNLPNLARVFIINFPKQVDIEEITSELSKHEEVEYAHGPVQLVNCAEYPNDTYYTNGGQWYLDSISAPEAWEITKGSTAVKIALIETQGVELTHSDLQAKIIGGDNNPAGIQGGHGTWVAGFAGAVTNNGTGVASLGWNIKLLTYQPNNDDENRTVLAQKIKDAADAGAHVINLSFRTIKTGFTSCSTPKINSTLAPEYYYNWSYNLNPQLLQV